MNDVTKETAERENVKPIWAEALPGSMTDEEFDAFKVWELDSAVHRYAENNTLWHARELVVRCIEMKDWLEGKTRP